MKEIVIISGKGGTGKTSIAAAFAGLAKGAVLADCDVDAADLHLILTPKVIKAEDFSGGKGARVLTEKCSGCGVCFEVCRFEAIHRSEPEKGNSPKTYTIDPIACEGCGVCAWFCKDKAIEFKDVVNGQWFVSDTRFGPMVHAKLGIAEENSGKLVNLVRKEAKKIAEENKCSYILVDGSPGIGCPVISSITGADLVVIVTEPSVSGAHDFERVGDLAGHFGIPALVCINKADINPAIADHIQETARARAIPVIGRIRYDKAVTYAQMERKTVIEYTQGIIAEEIKNMWEQTQSRLDTLEESAPIEG